MTTPIKGYRGTLTQVELDLINAVKDQGEKLAALLATIKEHHQLVRAQAEFQVFERDGIESKPELARLNAAEPERWLAMARTDLQTGIMRLVRSIAQPTDKL